MKKTKNKTKTFVKKAILIITLTIIIPSAVIGYYSNLLNKEIEKEQTDINVVRKELNEPIFDVLDEFTATVYAYNSFENQTDSTPFWGAFGDVTGRTDIVANNCYKKGTIVEINGKKYSASTIQEALKRYIND